MEMKQYDHLTITRLKEGVLYIVIKNVDFISSDGCVPKSIGVRFQCSYN